MIRNTLLHGLAVALVLVGLGLVGCSDDTNRVITGSVDASADQLATDSDWPGVGVDMEEYIADGFYVGEDEVVDTEIDTVNPDDRFTDDNPSDKPIDNGKDNS